jgi:maltose/moltooligosaccharide transporter
MENRKESNKSELNRKKKNLSVAQIIYMSFGFLGIQFGFALQNGNASAILQNFGAHVEELSWFWLVAPLTGMIVQPIIGHYSDKTWNRMGRRKPYFLTGALICCLALVLLPNSGAFMVGKSALFLGAAMLMLMDASINVSMEPFRALVADLLPDRQRTLGFSIQTALIGVGAVLGSWLPSILSALGISASAPAGQVADNVIYSFYFGAFVFMGAILVTLFKTTEDPPEIYEEIHGKPAGDDSKGLLNIISDFKNMPRTMRQLGLVQFFSWFALFSMWVFTTPAVAHHIYKLPISDTSSDTFREAGNYVGFIFGIYNGVSAIYALLLPSIAAKFGRKNTHAFSLICGGLGLISMYFAPDKHFLIFSMIGVGLAWASILAMPYAILAGSIPSGKMGVYMGIFNFFITFPQIVNGIFGGPIVHLVYEDNAIYAIFLAGIFLILAAVASLYVQDATAISMKKKR